MAHGVRDERARLLTEGPVALIELLEEAEQARALALELGRDLHLAGMSWAQLGAVLGVSRQSARERFAPGVDAWRAVAGDVMPWEAGSGVPYED